MVALDSKFLSRVGKVLRGARRVLLLTAWMVGSPAPSVAQSSEPPKENPSPQSQSTAPSVQSSAPTLSMALRSVEADWKEKASPESWTTLAMFLLVLVGATQVVMFWGQLRIMRRGLRDGAELAKAARDSAESAKMRWDIAQKMERAFVTAEVNAPALPLASEGRKWTEDGETNVTAKVTLRNHGRTPALIRTVDIGLVALFSPPVKFRSFPQAQLALPPALVIAASGSYEIETARNFIRSEWQDMVSGKRTLLCGGRVLYDDVLDQRNETGFCWHRTESDGKDRYSVVYSGDLNYFRYNLPKHSEDRDAESSDIVAGQAMTKESSIGSKP